MNSEAGKLPGWTPLMSLLGYAMALAVLLASRHFNVSWWIGAPAAIAVAVVSVFLDRAIERKYAPSGRAN